MHPETERNVRTYLSFKAVYLKNHPYCELAADCFSPSEQLHHMKGHGRHGERLCEERWIRAACFKHHRWVHDHPKRARQMGLLGF